MFRLDELAKIYLQLVRFLRYHKIYDIKANLSQSPDSLGLTFAFVKMFSREMRYCFAIAKFGSVVQSVARSFLLRIHKCRLKCRV